MSLITRCVLYMLAGSLFLASAHAQGLPAGQAVAFTIDVSKEIHVGEPFDYVVRVLYRPADVTPDFPGLVRDIRFVPFEQLHLSRPQTRTTDLADGVREYTLVYPLQGINVIPHQTYMLDPVTLSWKSVAGGEPGTMTVQPSTVTITGYYPVQIFGQPFQPLLPTIQDYFRMKQLALALLLAMSLGFGIQRIRKAASIREQNISSHAEQLRAQFNQIEGDPRQQLLAYERILLALLFYYRQFSARDFWRSVRNEMNGQLDLQRLKLRFSQAYHTSVPEPSAVVDVQGTLETLFVSVQAEANAERQAQLDALKGTVWQRLRNNRPTFITGVLAVLFATAMIVMLAVPSLWRDQDVRLYNGWIEGLPERLFDNSPDVKLGSVDVEMLVQFSEQQDILQQLISDAIKSAYLYNFGTIVAKAYVSMIEGEDQTEDEFAENEAGANRPSFEFPKQLLANAVRLAPLHEDARRNLEIAIMLREAEKKDQESGQVQGEIGPPLPGFSRDLSPVLF